MDAFIVGELIATGVLFAVTFFIILMFKLNEIEKSLLTQEKQKEELNNSTETIWKIFKKQVNIHLLFKYFFYWLLILSYVRIKT